MPISTSINELEVQFLTPVLLSAVPTEYILPTCAVPLTNLISIVGVRPSNPLLAPWELI